MTVDVFVHPKVRKALRKLPNELSGRIVKKIKAVSKNPFRYLEHFEGGNRYKLRIGDYRLLVEIDNKILKIMVLDKRGRIYKR